jgi:ABC-type phosphate transport system ATPase subunit
VDFTAVFLLKERWNSHEDSRLGHAEIGSRTGYLVEFGDSNQIFNDPKQKEAQQYIKGEFS